VQKGKELNDFQRNSLDIEILSNLRFGTLEIRDTSVTRVTNNFYCFVQSMVTKVVGLRFGEFGEKVLYHDKSTFL
jgi:hypothetical protein